MRLGDAVEAEPYETTLVPNDLPEDRGPARPRRYRGFGPGPVGSLRPAYHMSRATRASSDMRL